METLIAIMKLGTSIFIAGTALLSVPSVQGTEWVTSEKLQADITEAELMKNLARLSHIAQTHGNNRAFGYPGFAASRDYIFERTSRFARTTTTWIQDFPALFSNVDSISFRVDTQDIYVFGLTYSPSTTPEGSTAPLVLGPSGTAACSPEAYAALNVTDKIVLVERGPCPTGGTLAGKVRPAAAAGAKYVIVYNNVPTLVTGGTLSAPDPETLVPSGFINQSDGVALRERLLAGEEIEAFFQQTQTVETKITQNVFAETKGGDPDNVIMVGAHLDSVKAGPGINDDGSGTSLILELLTGLKKYNVKNKVRFAWWGAEENGLVGSRYYTSTLPRSEADKILLYLNFDMVSRGYYGVFDGDGSTHGLAGAPGSDVIEQLFVDELTKRGVTVTPAVFTGGSDYASFMDTLKKPVGGLHTGTGVAQDPCYHQQCDGYENANATVLTVNAKAAAHVLATLAMRGQELIPRNRTVGAVRREAGDFEWTVVEGEKHVGSCGHDV